MTTTFDSFVHDPNDPEAPFRNSQSPPMTALRPNLAPIPSPPPPVPLPQVSPPPNPGRKLANGRRKVKPSQGDAVLIHYLDGGRHPEISAEAGRNPLANFRDDGGDEEEGEEEDEEEDDEDSYNNSASSRYTGSPNMSPDSRPPPLGSMDLKFFAAAALSVQPTGPEDLSRKEGSQAVQERASASASPAASSQQPARPHSQLSDPCAPPSHHPQLQILQPRDVGQQSSKPVLQAPITPYTPQGHPDLMSPHNSTSSQVLRAPSDIMSPAMPPTPASGGELPPMTPRSETNGHTPFPSLPSIRAQLGDQLTDQSHFAEKEHAMRHSQHIYPNSPPAGVPRMTIPIGHGSPPISPNNSYSQSMSPAAPIGIVSPYYYSSGGNTHPRTAPDYSSASSHTETPNTDTGSTPATIPSITDRMSIDNVTNPQTGTFICTYAGCTAPPFQTQYLLNSHANVHSSARPHYCPVKGCPRAEGGKGFKRKNEMIRHGLVHESPGYVCPFCPDREHKYPRPDNLQRHVRVHHVDKDKDDALLRDVLSQRPDGPNRGRRRRGVP